MTDHTSPPGATPSAFTDPKRLRFARDGSGLEFDRVANFSDAVFAIALTLIAVELKPPVLALPDDTEALVEGLWEMSDEIIIFFVAFAVMGNYWLANHRFVAGLRGMDSGYVALTLPYLAWVAFLPFPAALMGRYFDNPVAVSFFALNMAMVSLLEWVLLWRAHRSDLLTTPLTSAGFRLASVGALMPVPVFLLSIPIMWVDTVLGVVFWAANVPLGFAVNARVGKHDDLEVERAAPAS